MQHSLLDFFSDDPKERLVARLKTLVREILGDKANIKKVIICQNCSRYALVQGFIETTRKRIIIYPAGDRLEDGMYQEVYRKKIKRKFDLVFKIDGNIVKQTKDKIKFYGEICQECFNAKRERLVYDATLIAYELLLNANINTPPFESYWSKGKFIIRLPKKTYSFTSKDELRETIEKKIYRLLHENINETVSIEDIIYAFAWEVNLGSWRILELLILAKLSLIHI